jgi:hypothetical protein
MTENDKATPRRMLYWGDGAIQCLDCKVGICDSSSNYCCWCGCPLRPGLSDRRTPLFRLVSIHLAREKAAALR